MVSLTNVIVIHNTIIVVVVEVWWMIIMDNMDHMNDNDNMNNDNNENIKNNENNDNSYIENMTMISMRPFLMIWTNDSDDNHIWSWMITMCIVRGSSVFKDTFNIIQLCKCCQNTMVSPGKHTFFALGRVIRTSRVRCTTTSQGVEKVVICQISLHGFLRCHMGVSLNCGPSTAWGNPTESYNVGGFKGPQFEGNTHDYGNEYCNFMPMYR